MGKIRDLFDKLRGVKKETPMLEEGETQYTDDNSNSMFDEVNSRPDVLSSLLTDSDREVKRLIAESEARKRQERERLEQINHTLNGAFNEVYSNRGEQRRAASISEQWEELMKGREKDKALAEKGRRLLEEEEKRRKEHAKREAEKMAERWKGESIWVGPVEVSEKSKGAEAGEQSFEESKGAEAGKQQIDKNSGGLGLDDDEEDDIDYIW